MSAASVSLLAALLVADVAAAPVPREVIVPPALVRVTAAPELSGLVWSSALARYLVVTDDAGLRALGTSHAPWVLALDATGRLDDTPIPISGVGELDDPEAICAGPDGAFYVVTSHAPNREGRTPRARRQLLALEVQGRGLAVRGRLDLTAIEGDRSLLELAGLDRKGRLDVEGLAFREGALYVGLKSPLAASGGAVILRLMEADAAFRAGRIRAAALTRWAELPLCLETPAGRTCQGIADLLFLDDGALLIAANTPKGAPSDGGGAVWRLDPGAARPRLVRRFPGLKPEGLSLAPGGKSVVVVFDRGQEQSPLWMELADAP